MSDVEPRDRHPSEHLERPATHKDKHHNNGPKSNHPWEVVIDVYLNSVTAGKANFDVQTCLPTEWNGKPDSNPVIFFFNDGRNGFNITFRLFDNTGEDYRFVQDKDDAIWSKLNGPCPERGVWDIFKREHIERVDDTTLKVFNSNKDDCVGDFQYTLRVVSDDANPINLDPGGVNMNGGSGRSWN
jgi:hypothetical protein